MDWIRKNSPSGKLHKENSTVLCWIQSHVEKTPSILSSTDLHHHYILQRTFPHIQALIVDVAKNCIIKHQFFNLTQHGKTKISKCMKKPHDFDSCRTGRTYCETVNYNFYDLPSLHVVDLNSDCEMEKLPMETLDTIFEYLASLKDIQNCLKTCTKWNKIIRRKFQNKGSYLSLNQNYYYN